MAYALLAWLACQSLGNRLKLSSTIVIALIYASVTGTILEILQANFTTSRQGDWGDVAANLLGAIAGCVVFSLRQRLRKNHESIEAD